MCTGFSLSTSITPMKQAPISVFDMWKVTHSQCFRLIVLGLRQKSQGWVSHNQSNVKEKQEMCSTSDSLRVRGEHKQLDKAQTERWVVVFPDDRRDEEDFAVGGQQQGSEEQVELHFLTLKTTHHRPEEAQHAAAEGWQFCRTNRIRFEKDHKIKGKTH